MKTSVLFTAAVALVLSAAVDARATCSYYSETGYVYVTKFGAARTAELSAVQLDGASAPCGWTAVSETPEFVTLTSPSSGSGSTKITFDVAPNPTGRPRTGYVFFANLRTTVMQTADAAVKDDLNGNLAVDYAWLNTKTGEVTAITDRAGINQKVGTVATVAPGYTPAGTGDFDGDGRSDIVWVGTGGDVWTWLMNGTTLTSSRSPYTVAPNYAVAGVGDFDADGKWDMLWFNRVTGDTYLWLMNGHSIKSSTYLYTVAPNFTVGAVGDFDGDGKTDILWTNGVSGDQYVWLMNGATLRSSTKVATLPATRTPIGIGDFDHDGKADVVWFDSATNDVYLSLMNGNAIVSTSYLQRITPAFRLIGVYAVSADTTGMLWRSTIDGTSYQWLLSGASFSISRYFEQRDLDWTPISPTAR